MQQLLLFIGLFETIIGIPAVKATMAGERPPGDFQFGMAFAPKDPAKFKLKQLSELKVPKLVLRALLLNQLLLLCLRTLLSLLVPVRSCCSEWAPRNACLRRYGYAINAHGPWLSFPVLMHIKPRNPTPAPNSVLIGRVKSDICSFRGLRRERARSAWFRCPNGLKLATLF